MSQTFADARTKLLMKLSVIHQKIVKALADPDMLNRDYKSYTDLVEESGRIRQQCLTLNNVEYEARTA